MIAWAAVGVNGWNQIHKWRDDFLFTHEPPSLIRLRLWHWRAEKNRPISRRSMSALVSFVSEKFPHVPHFKFEDIPDLSGKFIDIVTDGNSDIGKDTVKASTDIIIYFFIFSKSNALY